MITRYFTHSKPELGLMREHRDYLNRRKISYEKYPCPFSMPIADTKIYLSDKEFKDMESALVIPDEGIVLFPSLKIITFETIEKREAGNEKKR